MAKVIYSEDLTRTVRRNGRLREVTREVHTMAIPKGQRLYVRGILGSSADTDEMADVQDLDDGHFLLVFNQDALVRVEGLHDNLMTCQHLRFARPNRSLRVRHPEGERRVRRIFHNNITRFGRLLAALLQAGCEPVNVPGGLQYAIAYCHDSYGKGGEIIVPAPKRNVDYEHDGEVTSGFIIRKDEINATLATLPEEFDDDRVDDFETVRDRAVNAFRD